MSYLFLSSQYFVALFLALGRFYGPSSLSSVSCIGASAISLAPCVVAPLHRLLFYSLDRAIFACSSDGLCESMIAVPDPGEGNTAPNRARFLSQVFHPSLSARIYLTPSHYIVKHLLISQTTQTHQQTTAFPVLTSPPSSIVVPGALLPTFSRESPSAASSAVHFLQSALTLQLSAL